MPPGQDVVAGQSAITVSQEVTRPANTTAYTALDAISDSTSAPTALSFALAGRGSGQYGMIVKALLLTDQKTCTARLRLHLFQTAPTAINDNSPYLTLYANAAIWVGQIDFPALATEDPSNSTCAVAQQLSQPLPYLCAANGAAADTTLYGLLEAIDAFTPASGQKFYVKLTAERG